MTSDPSANSAVFVIERSERESLLEAAAEHDVRVEEVALRGFEPVSTVTVVIFGAAAATAAVIQFLERRRGGQVIDLRPGAPKPIFRSADVLFGTAIIITADGEVRVEVKEPKDMFVEVISVLPRLLAGAGAGDAQDISSQLAEQLGDAVRITAEATPADRPSS